MNLSGFIIVVLISVIFIFIFEFLFENTKFGQFVISCALHVFLIPLFISGLMMCFINISLMQSIKKYGIEEKIETVDSTQFRCEQNIKVEKIKILPKEKTWFYKTFGNEDLFVKKYYRVTNVKN